MKRLGLMLLLVSGALTGSASAQVHIGVFTGGYYDGAPGGHPDFWFAIGGRLGTHVIGPVHLEVEGLHVPVRLQETRDLFAYRGNLRIELLDGGVRPFLLAGAGWQHWRVWTGWTAETGGIFHGEDGSVMTFGVGTRIRAVKPFWLRVDLRREQALYDAPTNRNYLATLGLEVSI